MNNGNKIKSSILKVLLFLGVASLSVGVIAGGFLLGIKQNASLMASLEEGEEISEAAAEAGAEAEAEKEAAAEAGTEAEAEKEVAAEAGAEAEAEKEAAAEAAKEESAKTDAVEAETAEAGKEGVTPAAESSEEKTAETEAAKDTKAETKEDSKETEAASEENKTETQNGQDARLIAARDDPTFWDGCPKRNVLLLTPNKFSRPQTLINKVNTLVIHYVANAGSSAEENRNYFESLSDGSVRSASAHFIIGLDGEIVQCIPIGEVAYACKDRNKDTLSIECCHPDESGKFNEATYYSLVDLAGWLCMKLDIDPQSILRHYDVTGKDCPKYYVENEDAWLQLKEDIQARYDYLTSNQE